MKNISRALGLLIGIIYIGTVDAQIAESVVYRKVTDGQVNRFVDCTNQDAGTVVYGTGIGQTADFNPQILALRPDMLTFCWGDSLDLIHMGGNLSGDPDVTTPAGFGYAIYTCPPAITGPTLQDIEADPCVLRNVSGEIQTVTQGMLSGNVTFFNEGFFQGILGGGGGVQVWFAPITYDFLDVTQQAGYETDTDNQPDPGPCVEVNVQDTFSVLYLNPIEVEILDDNINCGGELRITGGMPEYYDQARSGLNRERYTLNIFNEMDNTIVGFSCSQGRPVHEEIFQFSIPQPGRYRIIVTDAKGCDVSDILLDINCQSPVVQFGESTLVTMGDEHCVDVTAINFIDVISLQFQFSYDPAVLMFTDIRSINPQLGSDFIVANPTPGSISNNLLNSSGLEFNFANEILFTVCFTAIGDDGDCTEIELDPDFLNEIGFGCIYLPTYIPSRVCIGSTSLDIATCSSTPGAVEGSIIFGPTIGTPPFTYTIEDSANPGVVIGTGTFANVPDTIEHVGFDPGTYTITVTDANNVVEVAEAIIASGERLSANLTGNQPSCVGDTDGTLQLTTSGGIGTLINVWTLPNGSTVNNAINLLGQGAGMYSVLVTDENGCPAEAMRNLFVDSIRVTMMAERLTSCPGGTDGRVFAEATGGAAPYDFEWNGNPPIIDQLSSSTDNAPAGFQNLVVTDANGCTVTIDTFSLDANNTLDVDSSFMDLTCAGTDDGAISIIPISGTGPYTYDWNDIGMGDMDRTNLMSGNYTVRVEDSAGCFDSLSFTLTVPDSLNVFVDSTLSTPFICFGDMNGRIILSAVGGDLISTPPVVVWTDNVSDNFGASNLGGGTYDISVTDARGCEDLTTFTIQESAPITFTIEPITPPNCPGDSTDLIVSNGAGGAGGPYLFNVNGGPDLLVDSTTLRVPAGSYTIEVTDTIGCSEFETIFIQDPEPITILLPEEIIINLGDSTQFLNPDIRPLAQRDSIVSYQWSPPTGLSCDTCALTNIYVTESATYTLTITDVKGCMYSEDVPVRSRKIRNVFIPNAFTPNGDGNNPLFTPITGQGVNRIKTFRVFNRWGDMVYNVSNIPGGINGQLTGWDGTDGSNSELPIGVYLYAVEVEFIDGVEITYKGDVTLLR